MLHCIILLCVLQLFMSISTLMIKQETNLTFICYVVLLPTILFVGLIILLYNLTVTKVPKQFSKYLKMGYPELDMRYGYEAIKHAKNVDRTNPHPHFVLSIQDTFRLKECNDLVVVGFAQGIISCGTEVFLSETTDRITKQHKVRITAIETGPGKSAQEASDCRVALRIEKGNFYNIKEGSVLYC